MVVQQGGNHLKTRWYPGATVMKDSVSGTVTTYTYIGGDAYTAPCVAIRQGVTAPRYYYLIRDHLGSITHISDSTNTKLFEYSYDSCLPVRSEAKAGGRMRNPATWVNYAPGSDTSFISRGFTGHETLPWFNLINMNGRAYDPLIGQFLSPDNFVQYPDFTQNYNRFGYCFNNPLKFKDPSGYTALLERDIVNELWKLRYGGTYNANNNSVTAFGPGSPSLSYSNGQYGFWSSNGSLIGNGGSFTDFDPPNLYDYSVNGEIVINPPTFHPISAIMNPFSWFNSPENQLSSYFNQPSYWQPFY